MENSDKHFQDLLSNDLDVQSNAIKSIKEEGDLSIIKPLVHFLEEHYEHSVESAVVSILADVKNPDVKTILAECIIECQLPSLKASLLRITWESGLDYSDYMEMFIEAMLHDDFAPALEAATYLENSVHFLSSEQRSKLRTSLDSIETDRKFLAENIWFAIEEYEREDTDLSN